MAGEMGSTGGIAPFHPRPTLAEPLLFNPGDIGNLGNYCCVAPHPPMPLSLKTKAQLQFDRTVTDRSKLLFVLFPPSNHVVPSPVVAHCYLSIAICFFIRRTYGEILAESSVIRCECKANIISSAHAVLYPRAGWSRPSGLRQSCSRNRLQPLRCGIQCETGILR